MERKRHKRIVLACRFVPHDQWLVTHVEAAWQIRYIKQLILARCLGFPFDPREASNSSASAGVGGEGEVKPPSPITFAKDDVDLEGDKDGLGKGRPDSPVRFRSPREVGSDIDKDDYWGLGIGLEGEDGYGYREGEEGWDDDDSDVVEGGLVASGRVHLPPSTSTSRTPSSAWSSAASPAVHAASSSNAAAFPGNAHKIRKTLKFNPLAKMTSSSTMPYDMPSPTTVSEGSRHVATDNDLASTAISNNTNNANNGANVERYTLIRFSTGQILEDDLPAVWYDLRPQELVELHDSSSHWAAGFYAAKTEAQALNSGGVSHQFHNQAHNHLITTTTDPPGSTALAQRVLVDLPRHDPVQYALPYWEGWVRALRTVYSYPPGAAANATINPTSTPTPAASGGVDSAKSSTTAVNPDPNSNTKANSTSSADPTATANTKTDPSTKMHSWKEWRERYVVIQGGVIRLFKTRDDPTPTHRLPLTHLIALKDVDDLSRVGVLNSNDSKAKASKSSISTASTGTAGPSAHVANAKKRLPRGSGPNENGNRRSASLPRRSASTGTVTPTTKELTGRRHDHAHAHISNQAMTKEDLRQLQKKKQKEEHERLLEGLNRWDDIGIGIGIPFWSKKDKDKKDKKGKDRERVGETSSSSSRGRKSKGKEREKEKEAQDQYHHHGEPEHQTARGSRKRRSQSRSRSRDHHRCERERERERVKRERMYIPSSREEAEAAGMLIVCAKFRPLRPRDVEILDARERRRAGRAVGKALRKEGVRSTSRSSLATSAITANSNFNDNVNLTYTSTGPSLAGDESNAVLNPNTSPGAIAAGTASASASVNASEAELIGGGAAVSERKIKHQKNVFSEDTKKVYQISFSPSAADSPFPISAAEASRRPSLPTLAGLLGASTSTSISASSSNIPTSNFHSSGTNVPESVDGAASGSNATTSPFAWKLRWNPTSSSSSLAVKFKEKESLGHTAQSPIQPPPPDDQREEARRVASLPNLRDETSRPSTSSQRPNLTLLPVNVGSTTFNHDELQPCYQTGGNKEHNAESGHQSDSGSSSSASLSSPVFVHSGEEGFESGDDDLADESGFGMNRYGRRDRKGYRYGGYQQRKSKKPERLTASSFNSADFATADATLSVPKAEGKAKVVDPGLGAGSSQEVAQITPTQSQARQRDARKKREEERGEWIILDMGTEHAYSSFLRVLHRHFSQPLTSTFVKSSITGVPTPSAEFSSFSPPETCPAEGTNLKTSSASNATSPTVESSMTLVTGSEPKNLKTSESFSSLCAPSLPKCRPERPSLARADGPDKTSREPMISPAMDGSRQTRGDHPSVLNVFSITASGRSKKYASLTPALHYPEWRHEIVERARRHGMREAGRPLDLATHGWSKESEESGLRGRLEAELRRRQEEEERIELMQASAQEIEGAEGDGGKEDVDVPAEFDDEERRMSMSSHMSTLNAAQMNASFTPDLNSVLDGGQDFVSTENRRLYAVDGEEETRGTYEEDAFEGDSYYRYGLEDEEDAIALGLDLLTEDSDEEQSENEWVAWVADLPRQMQVREEKKKKRLAIEKEKRRVENEAQLAAQAGGRANGFDLSHMTVFDPFASRTSFSGSLRSVHSSVWVGQEEERRQVLESRRMMEPSATSIIMPLPPPPPPPPAPPQNEVSSGYRPRVPSSSGILLPPTSQNTIVRASFTRTPAQILIQSETRSQPVPIPINQVQRMPSRTLRKSQSNPGAMNFTTSSVEHELPLGVPVTDVPLVPGRSTPSSLSRSPIHSTSALSSAREFSSPQTTPPHHPLAMPILTPEQIKQIEVETEIMMLNSRRPTSVGGLVSASVQSSEGGSHERTGRGVLRKRLSNIEKQASADEKENSTSSKLRKPKLSLAMLPVGGESSSQRQPEVRSPAYYEHRLHEGMDSTVNNTSSSAQTMASAKALLRRVRSGSSLRMDMHAEE